MFTWLALLAAPSLVLVDLMVAYALVTPTCAQQQDQALHWVSAAFLVTSLLLTALAATNARQLQGAGPVHTDNDHAEHRALFLARVATWVGALSSLVIAARWIPQWFLSPCFG